MTSEDVGLILRASLAGGRVLEQTAEQLGLTPTRLVQRALQLAEDPDVVAAWPAEARRLRERREAARLRRSLGARAGIETEPLPWQVPRGR